ncbi:hypothetical protein BCV09_18515 [Vibrio cyclitrophicus]|uniref:hypothetical protein n=1 Tax=Vibrio TaxID=662 RepID=UPI000C851A92|nr:MULTISPECIES: hypothetical protein [Vibrio]MBE8604593.1 hypothetical protein [Vibrio sp. OPT10]PME25972.1 hypothetical protein BCV41_15760 [Vibrio cyclitrophicus]PME44618.1 hypothetical protein BCV36_07585 [Vibrio cyclitrophicus]PME93929.1 hypothetical protein BCV26_10370 [Vibrio cyclitrophicus]PMF43372.1 hypothetical protein BCV15_00845 [Vibrio cyclitrophicus]
MFDIYYLFYHQRDNKFRQDALTSIIVRINTKIIGDKPDEHAVKFWKGVISDYTSGNYVEDQYQGEKWGLVTRQGFSHDASTE